MLRDYVLAFSIVLAGFSSKILADEITVEFSGFASVALSYSDDQEIGFRSNYLNNSETGWSLKRDSIVGGQVNLGLSANWDSVVQVVYQDRQNKVFDNFLELAFLRYRPNRNWALRAGRLNSDLYLLSEYPYVGYAYLWARPPHEFYSFASTLGHFDGADVEYRRDIADGFLRVKLAGGSATPKLGNGDEEFSVKFDDLYTLSAVYVNDNWTYRASSSSLNIAEFTSGTYNYLITSLLAIPGSLWAQASSLARGLDSQYHSATYHALGVTYENSNWTLQSEIAKANSRWLLIPSNTTGYLSLAYRLDNVSYYGGVSYVKNKDELPLITLPELPDYLPPETQQGLVQLAYGVETVIQRTTPHQYSFNLGMKWYASDDVVFKAQLDHFILQKEGGGLWDIDAKQQIESQHHINLFSLSASTVF